MSTFLVGLTGNIGAGKSTVAEIFGLKGATLIDADLLAREAVAPDTPGFSAILERWGDDVLAQDGGLDRAALRRIVFSDPIEREALNTIVHPRVEELRQVAVADARARGERIVVCDIPLLYEKGLESQFDSVVLVDAPRSVRLHRLIHERGLNSKEAEGMIDAQMSPDAKKKHADYVIDNAASHAQLEQRTLDVWRSLVRDADRKSAS